mgnify:CR=1 FL=1
MNVLYMHSHDTGRFVQPYGYPMQTPALQRFAEEGVVFRNAFCAGPTCSPSRAALLTGTWPHVNGMIGLAHRGPCRLRDYSWHLSNFLKKHGYQTALSGVQHEVGNNDIRRYLGYDRCLEHEPPVPDRPMSVLDWNMSFAERAAAYISEADPARPFFLSCGFGLTHRTGSGIQWHNGDESPLGEPRWSRPPPCLPDTPEIRRDFADFSVAVSRLDACIGRVLEALDRSEVADNTLVIVTTDHGIAFPHMKCNLTDWGIGVMLMMRGPKGFSGGKVIDALVSHIDIFPTVCGMVGLPVPKWVSGSDLTPLVNGRTTSVHDAIFAEVNWHAAVEPMRVIRTGRWAYIRRYGPERGPVLPNCDDSPSKEEMLRQGWAQSVIPAERLFDLAFDPCQTANIAGSPAHSAVLADMRNRLERWMKDTDDPLLAGGIDPWPGMVVNPPDGSSPQEPCVPAERFAIG